MSESTKTATIEKTEIDPGQFASQELQDLHHHLSERVKELQCLYGITQIVEQHGDDLFGILRGIVKLIPPSWQFPEVTCAKITFERKQFTTKPFSVTEWRQSADIIVNGITTGVLEIYYLNEMPRSDEGPFLKEERTLANAISERIGRIAERISAQKERRQLHYEMQERIKELQCLYGISQLVDKHGDNLTTILRGIVDIIPPSWQFPEVTCARLTLGEKQYQTDRFRESQWKQSADILIEGKHQGQLEVYYTEEMPRSAEGPFLSEERALLDAISEQIGRLVERISARETIRYTQEELKMERALLEENNTAIRVVLSRIEDEKKEIRDTVAANVDKVLMPTIHMLESEVPPEQSAYVGLLKAGLLEITSPLIDKLTRDYLNLTPVEAQICNMVRRGLTTKEIARIRHVATSTVRGQRESIRRKLGLLRQNVNLVTFLQTYEASHVNLRPNVGR